MLYTIYSFTVSNVVYIMCKCYIFPSTDAEESSLPFSHMNFHFLNEDDLFDDEAGVEGFYIFYTGFVLSVYPPLCGLFSFNGSPKIELSYEVKKEASYLTAPTGLPVGF